MPRTGAYIMVRLAHDSKCNTTVLVDAAAAAAAAGETAAAAANVAAAAEMPGGSSVCVGSMMAQEGLCHWTATFVA
jgi:hypothetical protein